MVLKVGFSGRGILATFFFFLSLVLVKFHITAEPVPEVWPLLVGDQWLVQPLVMSEKGGMLCLSMLSLAAS